VTTAVPTLAHDDAGGVVGEDGGFDGRRSGHDGQGEGGDDGVAGAGHVVDFLGDGWDMKGFTIALAEEHAAVAEGDEQDGGAQCVQQLSG
jgi:hypothetical protein